MLVYCLLLILGYFLFRLTFNLIIPVVRSTKAVRQQFAQMREEALRGHGNPTGTGQAATGSKPKPTPNWDKMGDYIDFEEVK